MSKTKHGHCPYNEPTKENMIDEKLIKAMRKPRLLAYLKDGEPTGEMIIIRNVPNGTGGWKIETLNVEGDWQHGGLDDVHKYEWTHRK